MSKVQELIYTVQEQVESAVEEMTKVSADKLGLDIRAGYRLRVDSQYIAVSKQDDRSLQYYGGFEYVDKDSRTELGDYVFYSRDADRVNDCLETYEAELQEAE